ncbi:hypothetical protein J6590_104178, partial [Homalodisca vitripennis]
DFIPDHEFSVRSKLAPMVRPLSGFKEKPARAKRGHFANFFGGYKIKKFRFSDFSWWFEDSSYVCAKFGVSSTSRSGQNCVVQDLVQHEHSKLKAISNRSLKITCGEAVIDRKRIFQAHAALITPVEQIKEFLQDKYVSSYNFKLVEDVEDSSSKKLSNNNSLKITLALRDFLQNKYSSSQNCVVQDLVHYEHSKLKATSNRSLKITCGEAVIDRKRIFQAHAALITPVEQVNIIYQWVVALRNFLQNKYSSCQNCLVQDLVQNEHSDHKTACNRSLKITHSEVVIDRKRIFQAHAALITQQEQFKVEALREFLQDKYVSRYNLKLVEDVEDSSSKKLSNNNSLKITLALRDFLQNKYSSCQNCLVQDLVQHEHSKLKAISNRSLKITFGEAVIDRKRIFQAHAALITPVEQVNVIYKWVEALREFLQDKYLSSNNFKLVEDVEDSSSKKLSNNNSLKIPLALRDFLQNKYSSCQNCLVQDLVQHEHSKLKAISNRSLKITFGEAVIDRKRIFQAHAALITPVEQVNVIYIWVEALREFLQDKYLSSNNFKLVEDVEDSSSKKLSNNNSLKIILALRDFLQNKYSSCQNCLVQDLVQHEHSKLKATSNRSLNITRGEAFIDRKSIFQAHAALITPVEQALREFLQDKYLSSNNFKLVEDVEDSSSKKLSNNNSLKIILALRDFLQNKYSSCQNCLVQDLIQHEHSKLKAISNRSLKITCGEAVIDRKRIFQAHAALITPALREFLQDKYVSSYNFKLVEDVEDSSSKKLSNNNSLKITLALRDFLQNKYSSSQNCVVQDLVHYEHSKLKATSNRSLKITCGEAVIDRKRIFQAHAALITPVEQVNQNCVVQNLVQHEHSNRKSTSNKSLKISHGEGVIDRKSIFQAHAALITPVEQVNQNCVVQDLVQHEHSNRKSTSNKSLKISHGEVAIDRKSIFQAHAALITPVEQVNQNCVLQDLVQHEHSNRKTTSNTSLKITHGEVVIDRKSIFQAHAALITPVEQVNQNCVVQDLVHYEHSKLKATSNRSLKITCGEAVIDRKRIFQAHAALITPVEQVK